MILFTALKAGREEGNFMLDEEIKQQNYCYRNDLIFVDPIHDKHISIEEFTKCQFLLLSLSFLMFFTLEMELKNQKWGIYLSFLFN